jgi:uncharacterized membrane protein
MQPEARPPLVSLWDYLALLGFGSLWVFYMHILPTLPDPVPTHFNAVGIANGWTPKAALPFIIFGLPLFIWATTTAVAILTSRNQEDPARARANAMQPLRGCLGLGLPFLMGSMLLVPAEGSRALFAGLGGFFALLCVGLIFLVRDCAKVKARPETSQFYRWGLFYVNPGDARVFVEKRMGVGYTLNFARPASWLFMALLLLPLLVAVLVVRTAP